MPEKVQTPTEHKLRLFSLLHADGTLYAHYSSKREAKDAKGMWNVYSPAHPLTLVKGPDHKDNNGGRRT